MPQYTKIINSGVPSLITILEETWKARELILILALRAIVIRYKQTIIGGGWVLIQPVMLMVVFSVLLGAFAKLPSNGLPYPIFIYLAILPWQFFSKSLAEITGCIVANKDLITKVYFQPFGLVVAITISSLFDLFVSLIVLVSLLLYFKVGVSWYVVLAPLYIIQIALFSIGLGSILSAINLKYRDIGHAIPFLTQIWMFLTPVVYPASLIPEKWSFIYELNPLFAVIEGFRWAVVGGDPVSLTNSCIAIAIIFMTFLLGVKVFSNKAPYFADQLGA